VTYRTRAGHASTFVDFAKWDARPMMTELFSSSLGAAKKFGAQLIILDTASDIFVGNEIARDQVRAFITLLRRWAILADGCVILTAHVSNEGLSSGSGLSGSRAWSNSVRSRLWLTEDKKDEGGTQRFLKTMKQNYGARGGKIPLRWRNGVFEKIELVAKNWSEPGLEWPER
jgi:RecA-family ATPase